MSESIEEMQANLAGFIEGKMDEEINTSSPLEMRGKVALVTGGGSGIGEAVAIAALSGDQQAQKSETAKEPLGPLVVSIRCNNGLFPDPRGPSDRKRSKRERLQ